MDLASALGRISAEGRVALEPAAQEERAAELTITYLSSRAAIESLRADPYWPKWDSPWWHMLLLHELGRAAEIPAAAVEALVRELDHLPMKVFPIHPGDVPTGFDSSRAMCHCALGCIVPVLLARGVDVDAALPWAASWFARYQMADGGLNCDEAAYRVMDEVASSMVGTVASLEAALALEARRGRAEDGGFLDRAGAFLLSRALTRGSDTRTNAEERDAAPAWGELTFPRFYFYDVLRGLSALLAWASRRQRPIPWQAVAPVVTSILERFPDGRVRVERNAFAGHGTRLPAEDGTYSKRGPALRFPLLDVTSRIGDASPSLTRSWNEAKAGLLSLARDGLILEDGPG